MQKNLQNQWTIRPQLFRQQVRWYLNICYLSYINFLFYAIKYREWSFYNFLFISVTVLDSFELIAQEYVMVSNPPLDMSSSDCASELNHLPSKVEYPLHSGNVINLKPNVPVKLTAATTKESCNGCSENHVPAPSETSLGSFCIRESPEQPSTDSVSRIKALQNCASTITQLVNEKVTYFIPRTQQKLVSCSLGI